MTDSNPAVPASVDELLRHQEWLRRLARRLVVDAAAADDAVQQTWLAALERPPRSGRPVRGWLATVLRNAVRKRHRETTRRDARERTASGRADDARGGDPAETIERFEQQRLLVQEVAALDEPYRTTVLLRFFEDLPPREIATRLDVPVKTVETRLLRARRTLRERMDARHGGDREAWCAQLAPWALSATGGEGAAAVGVTVVSASKIAAAAAVAAAVWVVWGPSFEVGERPHADAAHPTAEAQAAAPAPRDLQDETAGPVRLAASDATAPADEEEAARGAGAADTLVVRVEDDLGAPAREVGVALVRDGVLLAQEVTDGRGEVAFDPVGGTLDCAVTGGAAWPSVHRVDASAGTRTVRLPAGVPLGGRVVVDGATPPESLKLLFDVDARSVTEPALPPAVWRALGERGVAPSALLLRTADDGTFRFVGLPPGVAGRLRVHGDGFVREDGAPPRFPVDAPRGDLVLRLSALPVLAGQVVDPHGGPVEALLFIHVRGRRGHSMSLGNVPTGSDGRFEHRLHRADVVAVDVEARTKDRRSLAKFRFEGPFAGRRDVGELRLEGTRERTFRVVDARDRPIAGAVAYSDDGRRDESPPSDAAGHVTAEVGPDARRLIVVADGFAPAEVPVAAVLAPDSVVRLRPATSLVVQLEGSPPHPHDALRVAIRSAGDLFPDVALELVHMGGGRSLGENVYHGGEAGSGGTYRFDRGGKSRVPHLSPRVPFDVVVATELGVVLDRRTLVLSPGETREVVVPVPDGRRVAGVVVDPHGRPLGKARVHVAHGEAGRRYAFTESDGRFVFEDVLAPDVTLLVARPGFSPARLERIAVPADGLDLTVRLEPGRVVEVEVVDTGGAPVDGLEVTATSAAPAEPDALVPGVDARQETAGGRTTLRDVPDGPITVAFEHAGVTHERLVPAGADTVRVVVPATGSVAARTHVPVDRTRHGELRLAPLGDRGAAIADGVTITPLAPSVEVVLPRVVPGRYRATLELWHDDWEEMDVVATGEVEVVAGVSTTVVWE